MRKKLCFVFMMLAFLISLPKVAEAQTTPRVKMRTKVIQEQPAQRAPLQPKIIQQRTTRVLWQQLKVMLDITDRQNNLAGVGQCATVNIPLKGKSLNLITSSKVTNYSGQEIPGVYGRLDWPAYKDGSVLRRNVGLQAACTAVPGNYNLQLYQGTEPVVSGNFQITVYEKPVDLPPPVYEKTVSSTVFKSAFDDVFSGAIFMANSSGGKNDLRNILINVPLLDYAIKQPLSRYEERTTGEERALFIPLRGYAYTVCKVRSSAFWWMAMAWNGFIHNGNLVIRLNVQTPFGFKMRGMMGPPCEISGNSVITWKWGSSMTDLEVPDFKHNNLKFYVTLKPIVDSQGRISYGNVGVSHSFTDGSWNSGLPIPPSLKTSLINYMENRLGDMKNELFKLFNKEETRNRLADAIMNHATGIDNIISVSGSGQNLIVIHR